MGGVTVHAGEPVLVDLPAANRDPAVFRDADTLVLDRVQEAPHLAFGHGAHFRAGARPARLEPEAAVGTLLERLPTLKRSVSGSELRWKTEAMIKGLHELPVDW
ncbi:hypothetical protein [Streptomyces sp. NPDC059092]|uniref:hypothetical protein n=1 Tax=Streptomyces sp. NPDC059092 TaxID=3346725 RepID=UPI0036CD96A9